MPGPTHFREPFREFKPDPTKYYIHRVNGYWRICISHERYKACGNKVLWDDMADWKEAMAIVNQIGIISWAARFNQGYGRGCWL